MIKYETFMSPIEKFYLGAIRKDLMSKAKGNVLEIGFGNGANMQYYNLDQIDTLHALDISETMNKFDNVEYHILSAERLPFVDNSFDTVVLTLALCSIPNPEAALLEIRRVLKDDGSYLFIEHQAPKNRILQGIFNLVNPLWKRAAKGCQINLHTSSIIMQTGFNFNENIKSVFHYGEAYKMDKDIITPQLGKGFK